MQGRLLKIRLPAHPVRKARVGKSGARPKAGSNFEGRIFSRSREVPKCFDLGSLSCADFFFADWPITSRPGGGHGGLQNLHGGLLCLHFRTCTIPWRFRIVSKCANSRTMAVHIRTLRSLTVQMFHHLAFKKDQGLGLKWLVWCCVCLSVLSLFTPSPPPVFEPLSSGPPLVSSKLALWNASDLSAVV